MNSGARARTCRRRAGDGALADPSICVWRRASRESQKMNFPGAEDVSRALNRSDTVPTDQKNLSRSAVSPLTDRGHIWVSRAAPGRCEASCIKPPLAGSIPIEGGGRRHKGKDMATGQLSGVIQHLRGV